MAQKQAAPTFVVVALALLFFAAATPTAYGQLGTIVGPLGNLTVNGKVCCSPTANCNSTTAPLPGVVVKLNCTGPLGISAEVGQGVTGVSGNFSINASISNILNSALVPLPCATIINLPINNLACPILNSTNSILVGVLGILSSTLATVLKLTVQLWIKIAV